MAIEDNKSMKNPDDILVSNRNKIIGQGHLQKCIQFWKPRRNSVGTKEGKQRMWD